jgi:multidrug resistance efflux pump
MTDIAKYDELSSEEKETLAATPANPSTENETQDPGSRMRKITLCFLGLSLIFATWCLFADRLTPSTSQARVRGYIVKVASEVPGKLEKIHVVSDQYVNKGDLLFEVEEEPYLIAIQEAEAALEDARQQIGGDEKGILAAEAGVVEAKVRYETAYKDAMRASAISKSGAIAERDVDIAFAKAEEAKAGIAKAEASLEEVKKRFGQQGTQNTKFKKALAQLEQARLNLKYTNITAPSDGVVSNMKLEVGHYASTGAMLVSVISVKDVWVEAYLRENNLGNLKHGNKVEIALDSAPGKVFSGEVESISYGVKWNKNEKQGELATIATNSGWLRDPQRFPVVIKFSDDTSVGFRREGGQADVIVYTGENWLMNALGKLWVRVITTLSYIY